MKIKKGFTLVELIVSMTIIAILAAVIVPTSLHFVNKADNDKKQAILQDYMSRLCEVANTHDPKIGNLDSTKELMELVSPTNANSYSGYSCLAVLNDSITNFNDESIKDVAEYKIMQSGEAFTVCIFQSGSNMVFRLKFYKDGKVTDIKEELNYRPI